MENLSLGVLIKFVLVKKSVVHISPNKGVIFRFYERCSFTSKDSFETRVLHIGQL